MNRFAVGAAAVGALLHVGFAFSEMFRWGDDMVERVAPSWLEDDANRAHVAWARDLAFNVGAYNLALAIGLGVTAWAYATGAAFARPFGLFMALWLLIAAAAAIATGVTFAFYAQGALGVALLAACLRSR